MVVARTKDGAREEDLLILEFKPIGRGAFGQVFSAKVKGAQTNEKVAIKQTPIHKLMPTRELEILKKLGDHANIIKLKFYFYESVTGEDDLHTENLVLELFPLDLYSYQRQLAKQGQQMAALQLKLFSYQLFRAVGYLGSKRICHRDIKPHNILVNCESSELKLCDFGCAKQLTEDGISTTYVATRFYRAPEILLGSSPYTCKIDIWSIGCVMAEMTNGRVLFKGDSNYEMFNMVTRVLGTPTKLQMTSMKPTMKGHIPHIDNGLNWPRNLIKKALPLQLDLLSKVLQYNPKMRPSGYEALTHGFFDELRMSDCRSFPPLFDFSGEELSAMDECIEVKLRPCELF